MAVNWAKAKTAYVTSEKSYRDIAKQFKVSPSVVSKKGKEDGWVEARAEYRAQLSEKSLDACQSMELERLKRLQDSAMKMCERLEAAISDDNELYTHAGVEGKGDGCSVITEKRLQSIDAGKVRNLCSALQTMTNTMRNLFEIQTRAQQQQLEMAREKLQLDKQRAEREAKNNERDTDISITFTPDIKELVE